MSVALLSGGTGGAKLARGLYELLGSALAVIANTGDDLEIYGAEVSPDPDLVSFWLADRIDERGWGIDGDSFNAMEMFAQLGHEIWFSLGDRDLALCLERRRLLESGLTRSAAQAALTRGLGVTAAVIPMSDERVRTTILSEGNTLTLHEFLIGTGGGAPIDDVRFEGAAAAAASPAALAAIAAAEAIVIGPSNPIISIGPILAIEELREAIEASAAPVIAVSPIVGGKVLKGPTAACLDWAGHSADAAGVVAHYGSLIDAIVADEPVSGIRSLECDTWMGAASARRELARATLELAEALRGGA
ncbi:MAG TPA: 2-phospho-L-lactate transferase CofD family protein [Solirubrobacteraceae bacterium]